MTETPLPSGSMLRLVRHGQSTYNAAGRIQGHDDRAELTRSGVAEAEQAAYRIAARPVSAIWSSDLRRARQTAAVIGRHVGVPVQTDARLRERSLGDLEGQPADAAVPEAIGVLGDVVVDPDACPAGGESLRSFYQRVAGFLQELPPADGDVVIVAHGGTVRVAVAALYGTPVKQMGWAAVANGSVTDVAMPAPAACPGTGGS